VHAFFGFRGLCSFILEKALFLEKVLTISGISSGWYSGRRSLIMALNLDRLQRYDFISI
jgi:hypothetical protein